MAPRRPPQPKLPPINVEQMMTAIDRLRALLVEAGDPDVTLAPLDDLAHRAFATKRVLLYAASVLEQLELAIPEAMPTEMWGTVGAGVMAKTTKRSDRWKDPESGDRMRDYLCRQIVTEVATDVDPTTGEAMRDKVREEAAAAACKAFLGAVGSFSQVLAPAQHRYRLDMTWYRSVDEVPTVELIPEGGRW